MTIKLMPMVSKWFVNPSNIIARLPTSQYVCKADSLIQNISKTQKNKKKPSDTNKIEKMSSINFKDMFSVNSSLTNIVFGLKPSFFSILVLMKIQKKKKGKNDFDFEAFSSICQGLIQNSSITTLNICFHCFLKLAQINWPNFKIKMIWTRIVQKKYPKW